MKQEKKFIWKAIIASLPVMAFLACGNVNDTDGLIELLNDQEETAEEVKTLVDGENARDPSVNMEQNAFVHICGEVESPGVYEVSGDSRVCDVLNLAGGFTREVAQSAINLAEQVTDGMMIVVPSVEDLQESTFMQEIKEAGLVNINTASEEELCTLPGIGKSRAEAIISYREEYGSFTAKEDIMQVTGIKSGMYEKLKDKIYVKDK